MKKDLVELLANGFDPEALRAKYDVERDKRFRPEGTAQFVRATGEWANFDADPHVGSPPSRAARMDEVEVAIIGAGFGGLLAGARLRDAGVASIRLIDVAGDVGGTWYWNRYPGVQCDVESYIYLPLLEETGYVPTLKYVYGAEIFEHSQRIAKRYDLYADALFQTRVTSVEWREGRQRWEVKTDRGDDFAARFVVIANGNLSRPQLPGIPGMADFKGKAFHTSRWDFDYTGGDDTGGLSNLHDKRVGIIGTGATAVQVVPHLAESAQQLVVFQRTPSVVVARNNKPTDPSWADRLESGWQRKRTENFTRILAGEVADVDRVHDSWTELYGAVTQAQLDAIASELGRVLEAEDVQQVVQLLDMAKGEKFRDRIRSIVQGSNADALLPWYFTYCKRPCFHDEYLPAFNRSNVRLIDTVMEPIERVVEDGVMVSGQLVRLDCLVFATGFEVATSHASQAGYDPVGRSGLKLSEKWSQGPRTLHGLQTRSFPNLFTMGIIQNASSINFTEMLTIQADHLAYIVSTMNARGYETAEVTSEAEQAWLAEVLKYVTEEEIEKWRSCTPGYINAEGKPSSSYSFFTRKFGGGTLLFAQILADWRSAGTLPGVRFQMAEGTQ